MRARNVGRKILRACGVRAGELDLTLRSRIEEPRGSGKWDEVPIRQKLPIAETAILICDMWDKHWSRRATERIAVLAAKMAPLIDQARKCGIQIVHAPSGTMEFYRGDRHRLSIMRMPAVEPPSVDLPEAPPLPIDFLPDRSDDGETAHDVWMRQHPSLPIAGRDVISDQGREVYSLLRAKGIKVLLMMGVHTNLCVLDRSFGIKQMTAWGIKCVLVRDLTDAWYSPNGRPFVSCEQGTELMVEYIEKCWCPSVLSTQLAEALSKR